MLYKDIVLATGQLDSDSSRPAPQLRSAHCACRGPDQVRHAVSTAQAEM